MYFVGGRVFRVSMDRAKRSFSRATNGILSRLLGTAAENVIFRLVRSKTLPVLLYATEALRLRKAVVSSLDFALCGLQ